MHSEATRHHQTHSLDGDSFSNSEGPTPISQVAVGRTRLPRAGGPLIRVNTSLGRTRRSGFLHLFQGSRGTLSKNLQGNSPLSSLLPQRNIWRCSHAISCSPTITYRMGPLSATPVIEVTRFPQYCSALASQFVQRLSLGFRLRSLASLSPKALHFPAPCFPRPLTTHIEFKG